MQLIIFMAGIIVIVLGLLMFGIVFALAGYFAVCERRDKRERGRFRIIREFCEWLTGPRGLHISEFAGEAHDAPRHEIEDLLKDFCRFQESKSNS